MKISICIPTWEQHGNGVKYLEELFLTINNQSFKNFNVVVSDHSINDDIENLVKKYSSKFKILYQKNELNRGNGPTNTNNSIKMADGDIIKIMFQDDLFYSSEALKNIHDVFDKTKIKWLVNGCNHTEDGKTFSRNMIPFWNPNILIGVNTISSPSVLSFINEDVSFFDENLTMLMDCEYYYNLYKKYGSPYILTDILVSNRIHQHQISSMYDKDINQEIEYVRKKHLV